MHTITEWDSRLDDELGASRSRNYVILVLSSDLEVVTKFALSDRMESPHSFQSFDDFDNIRQHNHSGALS